MSTIVDPLGPCTSRVNIISYAFYCHHFQWCLFYISVVSVITCWSGIPCCFLKFLPIFLFFNLFKASILPDPFWYSSFTFLIEPGLTKSLWQVAVRCLWANSMTFLKLFQRLFIGVSIVSVLIILFTLVLTSVSKGSTSALFQHLSSFVLGFLFVDDRWFWLLLRYHGH